MPFYLQEFMPPPLASAQLPHVVPSGEAPEPLGETARLTPSSRLCAGDSAMQLTVTYQPGNLISAVIFLAPLPLVTDIEESWVL